MQIVTAGVPTARTSSDATTPVAAAPKDSTDWLSWLRFFAIAGVVTIHTAAHTAAAPDARSTFTGQLAILMDIGAVFTVPIFVMISGALLLDPARFTGAGTFLRKRALRLVPAIVFWHLFYVGFRVWYLDLHLSPFRVLVASANGKLFQALYFFWIILGLAVVAPVLIPWIATASRRAVLIGGSLAAAMPILTVATYKLRNGPLWVETAWTWWIFYLGLFLLGWGLRGVRLRGLPLAGTIVATVAIGLELAWQWRNTAAPSWLQTLAPISYFGISVHLYAILIFVVAQSTIRPDGMLRGLTRPALARIGRTLGDATLGVFALHPALVVLVVKVPGIGGALAASSPWQLLARVLLVLTVAYVIVLLLRKVPGLRQVL